jgi:hypothetical protein
MKLLINMTTRDMRLHLQNKYSITNRRFYYLRNKIVNTECTFELMMEYADKHHYDVRYHWGS